MVHEHYTITRGCGLQGLYQPIHLCLAIASTAVGGGRCPLLLIHGNDAKLLPCKIPIIIGLTAGSIRIALEIGIVDALIVNACRDFGIMIANTIDKIHIGIIVDRIKQCITPIIRLIGRQVTGSQQRIGAYEISERCRTLCTDRITMNVGQMN